MSHILHIDSSALGEASHSRQLSGELVAALRAKDPSTTVTYRDLGHGALPFVSETFVYGMYTPEDARTPEQRESLRLSDELIAELHAADLYVFGVPMYNFSVPAVFKAYIDLVVRANATFVPGTYEGLLKGKRAIVVAARGGGGYGPGEQREAYNFQDPLVRAAFGLAGVTDIEFVHVNNTAGGDDVKNGQLAAARARIAELAGSR